MVQGWKEVDRVRVTGSRTVIFYSRLSIQTKRSGAHCAFIHPTNNSESQAAYNSCSGIVSPGDSSSQSVSPYPCFPLPGGFYPVLLCQLLKWDTGVYHLHLTYFTACILSLSLSHCRLRWYAKWQFWVRYANPCHKLLWRADASKYHASFSASVTSPARLSQFAQVTWCAYTFEQVSNYYYYYCNHGVKGII